MKRLAAVLALAGTGCSWLMVAGPPSPTMSMTTPGMTAPEQPLDCTREKFAPYVDTVFASIFGVGTTAAIPGVIFLATEEDEWNRMFGGILVGAAVVYAAMAVPFYYSARDGFRKVKACRAAHEQREYFGAQ